MVAKRFRTVVSVTLVVAPALAQGRGGMGMGAGMMGMAHDSATMAQMRVIHELVLNNERITRTISRDLPTGFERSPSPTIPGWRRLIKEHVVTMDRRVRKADDPGLPMESPALHAIFRGHGQDSHHHRHDRQRALSSRRRRVIQQSLSRFSDMQQRSAIS